MTAPKPKNTNGSNRKASLLWVTVLAIGIVLIILCFSDLTYWTNTDKEVSLLKQDSEKELVRVKRFPQAAPLLKIDKASMPTIVLKAEKKKDFADMSDQEKAEMFASLRNANGQVRREERNKYLQSLGMEPLPKPETTQYLRLPPKPPPLFKPGPKILANREKERKKYQASVLKASKPEDQGTRIQGQPSDTPRSDHGVRDDGQEDRDGIEKDTGVDEIGTEDETEHEAGEKSAEEDVEDEKGEGKEDSPQRQQQEKEAASDKDRSNRNEKKLKIMTTEELQKMTEKERELYLAKVVEQNKDGFQFMLDQVRETIDPDLIDFAKSIGKARRKR